MSVKDMFRDESKIHSAIRHISAKIMDEPEMVKNYLYRGFCYYVLDRQDKAFEDFDRVLEMDPKNNLAYCLRGLVHGRQGSNLKSVQDFNRSVQSDPAFCFSFICRALLDGENGKYERALKDLKKAQELDSENSRIDLYMGEILTRADDFDGALESYERCMKAFPSMSAYVHRQIRNTCLKGGFHHAEIGEYEEAIRYYNLYLRENPAGANAYFYLGEAYMNLEDYEMARKNLLKSLELAPGGKMEDDVKELLLILDELSVINDDDIPGDVDFDDSDDGYDDSSFDDMDDNDETDKTD